MIRRHHRIAASVALALAWNAASSAVPVIPGAVGFGIETAAGRGGTVYRVTSLLDSGPGTLRECVAASGPRVCVFETSGTILLKNDLSVWNPRLTIAGQTAPAPGILLRGAGLVIHASDVLVQHLAVRAGDSLDGPTPSNRDALRIDSAYGKPQIQNIVIDHCSFSWGLDENASLANQFDNVTIRHSVFAEPLRESILAAPQGYNMLIHPSQGRVFIEGNLFAHFTDRAPLSRVKNLLFVNNVVYNYWSATDIQNQEMSTLNTLWGNVYRRGPDSHSLSFDVLLNGGKYGPVVLGTKLHVRANAGLQPDGRALSSDPWSIVKNGTVFTREQLETTTAPVWLTGLEPVQGTSDQIMEQVLAKVGPRPVERNSVDARIVSDVRNRSGRIINCVASDGSDRCARNAGGWPQYAPTTRKLTLPANPNADDDGDGYTNLEEYLQDMARSVEGLVAKRPLPPVVSVE